MPESLWYTRNANVFLRSVLTPEGFGGYIRRFDAERITGEKYSLMIIYPPSFHITPRSGQPRMKSWHRIFLRACVFIYIQLSNTRIFTGPHDQEGRRVCIYIE